MVVLFSPELGQGHRGRSQVSQLPHLPPSQDSVPGGPLGIVGLPKVRMLAPTPFQSVLGQPVAGSLQGKGCPLGTGAHLGGP